MALLVLLSLQVLSQDLFSGGNFSPTDPPITPRLKAASHTLARAAKLDFPATPAGRFVLEMYGELTPRSGDFLSAKEPAGVSLRSFIVVPPSVRMIILAPKVSRHLSKSVLNI
ncbi:MAG: hypothetical protein ACREQ2_10730 [Candidatus Binatia bacterium]